MVTALGIVIAGSAVQPWKALLLMVVIEDGRETEVRPVQSWKTSMEIAVTPEGISICVRPVQP